MFWFFKAGSFSWAPCQNSCHSHSGWCKLHNVFFSLGSNVELPGWNQASGAELPQRCTICGALLICLITGTFQGPHSVIYRINKQTQAINTFSLLGLNRLEHLQHRSGERTSTDVSFGEMMRRWKSLGLGRLFQPLTVCVDLKWNQSGRVPVKALTLGQGCRLFLHLYSFIFVLGAVFEKVVDNIKGRVVIVTRRNCVHYTEVDLILLILVKIPKLSVMWLVYFSILYIIPTSLNLDFRANSSLKIFFLLLFWFLTLHNTRFE